MIATTRVALSVALLVAGLGVAQAVTSNTVPALAIPRSNSGRPFPIVVRRRRSPAMATSSQATSR